MRLKLPAEVETLALVRREAEALGERAGFDATFVADLKTVLSEACGNVIRHAYMPGETGMLEAAVTHEGEVLRVVVRDWGAGFGTQVRSASTPGLHLGIQLIGALSRRMQVRSERGVGTELEAEMSPARKV